MIVLGNISLNISAMVYQHNDGAINIDYAGSEDLYVVQFKSITYTLHDPMEVNGDTITEVTSV